jgi:hypothetical protein
MLYFPFGPDISVATNSSPDHISMGMPITPFSEESARFSSNTFPWKVNVFTFDCAIDQ